MRNEEVKKGDHCWAMSYGEILVVLKKSENLYYVCGPWQEEVDSAELAIISVIDKPEGLENSLLYYREDDGSRYW